MTEFIARRVLLLAALAAPVAAGCRPSARPDEAPGLKAELEVTPSPPKVGPAQVVVTLTDEEGKPVQGAALELEGNMNHAGMKPVFAVAKEGGGGKYEAELEFTMGGDWFVLIDGRLADGRTFHRKIDVKGVKSR